MSLRGILILVLLLLTEGCDIFGNGPVGGVIVEGPRAVTIVPPGELTAGEPGTFTVSWVGTEGPFTVQYTFSGCASPLIYLNATDGTSDTLSVNFLPAATPVNCTLEVRVTDSQNASGSATRSFEVLPPPDPPVLLTATPNNDCSVDVTSNDPDGNDVMVAAEPPPGMQVMGFNPISLAANATARFFFAADDPFSGATGEVVFTASDPGGVVGETTATLDCPAITVAADTLYAIPLQRQARVGEPVRIMVASGDPANNFLYANIEVCASAASGAEYVYRSENLGALGGEMFDVDGIWAEMGTNSFLNESIPYEPIFPRTASDGRICFPYNITPLGASELVSGEGAVFSFELTFANPGIWQLGFTETDGTNRTYYQDMNQAPDFFWGDSSNDHQGVPNSVEVLP